MKNLIKLSNKYIFIEEIYFILIALFGFQFAVPLYCIYKHEKLGIFLFVCIFLLQITNYFKIYNSSLRHKLPYIFSYLTIFCIFCFIQLCAHYEAFGDSNIFLCIYIIISLVLLPKEKKIYVCEIYVKFITFLLFLSLIEYVLHLLGIEFILTSGIDRGEGSNQIYSHGIFNVYREGGSFVRFQSLMKEPGSFLGLTCILLLFRWKHITKFQRLIFLVSGLLTMSLFVYIMMPIVLLYNSTKIKIKHLFIFTIVFLTICCVIYQQNRDIFDSLIVERIEMLVKGEEDRTSSTLNNKWEAAKVTDKCFVGYGTLDFEMNGLSWGNTGVKADLYKYGYIGTLLLMVMSIIIIKSTGKCKWIWILLYTLCYYNGNVTFAPYFWIPFIYLCMTNYGVNIIKQENNENIRNCY